MSVKVGVQCVALRSGQQEGSDGGLQSDSVGSRNPPCGQWILPLHHIEISQYEELFHLYQNKIGDRTKSVQL